MSALLEYDSAIRAVYPVIAGVDEAGRGPLAGPVSVVAVILPPGWLPEGLNDSKKISEKKREKLYGEIIENALYYNIQLVENEVIDRINILQATMQGMAQALDGLLVRPDIALIDGNRCPVCSTRCQEVIGGDGKSASIAAASILAKVTRDRLMVQYSEQYPGYGFERHKGYPTKAHYAAIEERGITPIHRRSFLKKVLVKK